jgi:pimeloyl-ACP methyl ester carboxylesterase
LELIMKHIFVKSIYTLMASGLLVVLGCQTPIGVDRVGMTRAYQQITASTLTGPQISADSQMVIGRYGLEKLAVESPDLAIAKLQEEACKDNRRDVLFALAELSYGLAKSFDENTWVSIHQQGQSGLISLPGKKAARGYYFASAVYAYFYLFGNSPDAVPGIYDRHFRMACDFYNRGLAKSLTLEGSDNVVLFSKELKLPYGTVNMTATRPGFPWSEEQFHEFVAADEYTVRGLSPRERTHGLGVPLIGIPDRAAFGSNWPSYYLPGMKVAATAFLRIDGTVCDMTSSRLKASLELYSAIGDREIQVGEQKVPLETDRTAAIAYALQYSVQWKARMVQFFTGRELLKSGIYLTQPYVPGRIPVVFVYGTGGSPSDWAGAFNILSADPTVNSHFQFWFLVYNTGNPIAYSGWLLRDSLGKTVRQLDPEGKDAALREMVIIGHSQGGLVTKLSAVDSGDKFWTLISDKPIDQLGFKPAERELLGNMLIFEHSPYVKRVILACAPNLGSILVNNFIQTLAQHLISMPSGLAQLGTSLATLNLGSSQSAAIKKLGGKVPTSVANMNPDNPFLLRLHDLPLADGIKGDTIIGVLGKGPVEDDNDGVVAYKSAYLPGMETQNIVHCGHGEVPANPQAIDDIRRILLLHLKETSEAPATK